MRRRPLAHLAGLVLATLFAAAAPAQAQEEPAPLDGVELTDDWYRFSERFAEHLRESGRIRESIEEVFACGALHTDEMDLLADAAVLFIEFGAQQPTGIRPGSEYQRIADDLIRAAVGRGGEGDPRLAYAIGRIRFAAVDWATAYRMFREAREQNWEPSRVDPWYYRAVVNRSPLLIDAMRIDEAVAQIQEVLAEQPGHPEEMAARINLAVAFRRRDERVVSEKILRELVEAYPNQAQPWNTLGQVLFDQGRLEEALEAFRNAIALASAAGQPYEEALVSMAHVLYKLGRTEDSERATQNFLKLKRDAPGGLYLMALLERDKGNTIEAVRILRRAHRIAPRDQGILTLLQQVHYERNEFDEAEEIEKQLEVIRQEMEGRLGSEGDSEAEDDAGDEPGDGGRDDDGESVSEPEEPGSEE